ncbi:acetoacetate--CoA ligase [Oceanobacillus alkalisoli]|uniref:acetoacetate--CoA ligase n=1 Tax=Oceanobacillus alkalisoli TaxID=2925113 RepID=UPI001EF11213|nr:acetoacetate--CoA ligase [Oceanobacillus alkalisoli]MCF3944793.1 acetoacetate--CoA ligase [Oceanobacillus alkalisoli]MCG5105306.1 acetoacetate--CoA ligase [Oceanobacillus alkalisoli]
MERIQEGTLLWEPTQERKENSNLNHFMVWLQQHRKLSFDSYDKLWDWSVTELEAFWEAMWGYFDIGSSTPYQSVLSARQMPGAKWFEGATINYTEHVFRNRDSEKTAIIYTSEVRPELREVSWGKLYEDTLAIQQTLKKLGVQKGDRVVSYSANNYETVVAFLATASLGAIWSSASPDFGTQSVIDRFKQIQPKVMFAVDGYRYGGKEFDRLETVQSIQAEIPSLEATITIPYLKIDADFSKLKSPISWEKAAENTEEKNLTFEHVEFNEPLWILFSSGTTGTPKPIVHSQGGMLIEHLKALTFHCDLGEDDRFFWFTTTGWMMWNFLVGGLLTGTTIILYDGNPAYPSTDTLWKLAQDTKMNLFGTSASYITACMKEDLKPKEKFDLSALQNISSTGSPLPPEGFKWCYDNVKADLWIASVSGGTDVCTAFVIGAPILPVYAGELQCRGLGAKVESFDEAGLAHIDEVGELVLTEPFPAMPIFFWDDAAGTRLYESYFDLYDGIWSHGDYIKVTNRGTCVIYGRSDATINRGGIRIGTSEIYRAVDKIPEIEDSLIVDIPSPSGDSITPLFIVLKEGYELTRELKASIKKQIRDYCSPRHVPTGIYVAPDLPKTLNGKKLEVPVKKILMGQSAERVVNKGSLGNQQALDYFLEFAKEL